MPNNPPDDGSKIKSRMAFIRGELRSDAGRLKSTTSRFLDWTAHVREHPWASLGLTAALAYFLVPKRVEITRPSAEQLERLAANNHLVVETNPTPTAKKSMFGGLTALISHTVLQGAMGLIGQKVGQLIQPPAGPPRSEGGTSSARPRQQPPPAAASAASSPQSASRERSV